MLADFTKAGSEDTLSVMDGESHLSIEHVHDIERVLAVGSTTPKHEINIASSCSRL